MEPHDRDRLNFWAGVGACGIGFIMVVIAIIFLILMGLVGGAG